MKHIRILLTLILLPVMALSLFVLPAAAVEYCYSAKGTPQINGVKDELYNGSMMVKVGDPSISLATIWTLWDESYIYVFAQIYDNTPVDTPAGQAQIWHSDSLEVFVDRNNARTAPYQNDDLQVTIDIDGNINGQNYQGYGKAGQELSEVVYKSVKTDTGFIIEERIPLKYMTGENGKRMGIDFSLNNANVPGVRANNFSWGGGGNGGTNGWNTLVMMDTVPEDFKQSEVTQRQIAKDENVALFAFAAMDYPPAYGNYAQYAVDGNDASYAQPNQNAMCVLQIDLGNTVYVSKFRIKLNDINYMKKFHIEYSTDNFFFSKLEDKSFTYDSLSQTELVYSFAETGMCYVRIVPEEIAGGGFLYGHAINEFQLFASKAQIVILPSKYNDRGLLSVTEPSASQNTKTTGTARTDPTGKNSVPDLTAAAKAKLGNVSSKGNTSEDQEEIVSNPASKGVDSSTTKVVENTVKVKKPQDYSGLLPAVILIVLFTLTMAAMFIFRILKNKKAGKMYVQNEP